MPYTAATSPPHVYHANRLVSPSVGTLMTMDYELNQRNGSASSPSPSPTFGLPYDGLSESSSLAGSSVTTLSDHRPPYHLDQYPAVCGNALVDHNLSSTDIAINLHANDPFGCASRAPPPATSPTPTNVISCGQCGVEFAGQYRRGNLRRHVKHTHKGAKILQCQVGKCTKGFRRSDAWLKHARKQHPEICLVPALVQQGMATMDSHLDNRQWLLSSIPDSTADEMAESDSEASSLRDIEPSIELDALLSTARTVYTSLRNELGGRKYSQYTKGHFARWDAVVQQLYNQDFHAFLVYHRVLVDLRAVVDAFDMNAIYSDSQQYRYRPASLEMTGSGSGDRSRLTLDAKADTLRLNNNRKGRAQDQGDSLGNHTRTSIKDIRKRDKFRPIGCPFYQRAKMLNPHERPPGPCTGCNVKYMSECRSHFHPERVRTHHNVLPYYKHCKTCKRDFVDRQKLDEHHSTCFYRTIPHSAVLEQWIPLCLTLFPDDHDVPSPYVGVTSPLDSALVTLYRPRTTVVVNPILDERNLMSSNHLMPVPSPLLDSNNGPHLAAMGLVIHDAARPLAIPSLHRTNHIPGQVPTYMGLLQVIIDRLGPLSRTLAAFDELLNQRAPTEEETQLLADTAGAVHSASLDMLHHGRSFAQQQFQAVENSLPHHTPVLQSEPGSATPTYYQPMLPTGHHEHREHQDGGTENCQPYMPGLSVDMSYLTPAPYQPSIQFNDQPYGGTQDVDQQSFTSRTPASYQLSPTCSSLHYSGFDMSAQSSNQGFDARSSYQLSTMTGPTSTAEFSDVALDYTLDCRPSLQRGWSQQGQPRQSFFTPPAPEEDAGMDDQSLEFLYMGGGS